MHKGEKDLGRNKWEEKHVLSITSVNQRDKSESLTQHYIDSRHVWNMRNQSVQFVGTCSLECIYNMCVKVKDQGQSD